MSKPLGGRGKKAPYETAVIRVPVDLVPLIEEMVEQYRISAITEGVTQVSKKSKSAISIVKVSYQEVLTQAIKIIKMRRSAKYSLSKLLTFIYGVDVSEDSLKSDNIELNDGK